jgi:hypothetical protein
LTQVHEQIFSKRSVFSKRSGIRAADGESTEAQRTARAVLARRHVARARADGPVVRRSGAIAGWWADLASSTRVLVAVNGVVVAGVAGIVAALPLLP